jgi:hypothetical protein
MIALILMPFFAYAIQSTDFEIRVSNESTKIALISLNSHCTLRISDKDRAVNSKTCSDLASRYMNVLRNDFVHPMHDPLFPSVDVAIKFKGVEVQSVVPVGKFESCDSKGLCEVSSTSDIQKVTAEVLDLASGQAK